MLGLGQIQRRVADLRAGGNSHRHFLEIWDVEEKVSSVVVVVRSESQKRCV